MNTREQEDCIMRLRHAASGQTPMNVGHNDTVIVRRGDIRDVLVMLDKAAAGDPVDATPKE